MADNWVALEKGVFGKTGYQSGGALNEPALQATSGTYFLEIRPRQIALLEGLIASAEDPLTRTRLERALKPWKLWSNEARWWAFPQPCGRSAISIPPASTTCSHRSCASTHRRWRNSTCVHA
jgi:hypothetical protein